MRCKNSNSRIGVKPAMLHFNVRRLNALKQVNATLEQLSSLEPFFRGPGQRTLKRIFTEVFRGQGATRRSPRWRPLSPTSRRTTARRGILHHTGRLRRSFTNTPVVEIQGNRMRFGSNVPYAKYHETGTSRMPARPIVGHAAKLAPSRLQRAMRQYLREQHGH